MEDGTGSTTRGSGTLLTDPVQAAIVGIGELLASVAGEPSWPLSDVQIQDRVVEVLAVRASLEELAARLLRSVSDRDLPRLAGASSMKAWLMGTHGVSGRDAAGLVAQANAHPGDADGVLRDGRLEPTRRVWAAGGLSAERAVEIAKTIRKLDADLAVATTDFLQVDLAEKSKVLGFTQFRLVCARAVEVVDPDGADALLERQLFAEEDRALQQAVLSFRRVGDGTTRFAGRLPDVQADMFKAALDAYTAPRHQHRVVDPDGFGDVREGWTYPQRLGGGLVELVEHLPTDRLPQHGGGSVAVVVTMEVDQLLGRLGEATLDTGTVMSAGQARRLACNAHLVPAVLDGASRVLDLGIGRRLFDRHQRIALALRDGGCAFVGCERQASWCEAHHIRPWSRSGPTDIDNGCLLCPYHHHLIHSGEWQVVMAADGKPEIIPPARIDPQQRPRRHERFATRRRN